MLGVEVTGALLMMPSMTLVKMRATTWASSVLVEACATNKGGGAEVGSRFELLLRQLPVGAVRYCLICAMLRSKAEHLGGLKPLVCALSGVGQRSLGSVWQAE